MVDDIRFDLQLAHRFFGSVPKTVRLGLAVSKIKLGNQLLELRKHDVVEIVVISRYDFFLISRVFFPGHLPKIPFRHTSIRPGLNRTGDNTVGSRRSNFCDILRSISFVRD